MKARGLLAILGTSRNLRTARARLQDKLWSDRSPEQGGASLRQALAEIRRALGPDRDALVSGPGWVGLDGDRVRVDLDPAPGQARETVVFAEDLDIADPEFDDWLAVQRSHFEELWTSIPAVPVPSPSNSVSGPGAASVTISLDLPGDADLQAFAGYTLRDAATRAADFWPISVFFGPSADATDPGALDIVAHGAALLRTFSLVVTISRTRTGERLWSGSFEVERGRQSDKLPSTSSEIAIALLNSVALQSADGGSNSALRDVFSFEEDRLLRADRTLALMPESGISLALRAFIRNTVALERLETGQDDALDEAGDFARRALDLAPRSATVLSVASLNAANRNRTAFAVDLSEKASDADPRNPLSRMATSLALTMKGREAEAHRVTTAARNDPMTALSPATWTNSCAVTAVRAGLLHDARKFSEIAHCYAPTYRPALRFLGALNFKLGDIRAAEDALTKLRALEPDFSLQLMESTEYPVASLRAGGLLDVTRSGLI